MKLPRWLCWRSSAELDEEIQTHIEMETRANIEHGLDPDQARAAAKRRFGNVVLVRERAWEADRLAGFEALARDTGYALRNLARARGFTFAAVLTLALGIGAITAIYSVVDGVLWRSLPYPDADRLVRVAALVRPQVGVARNEMAFSDRGYWHFLNSGRAFEQFGGYGPVIQQALTGEGEPIEVDVARLAVSAFEVLGVSPEVGRWPSPEEDQPGGPAVALMSNALWRNTFGSDPSILGRTIVLDGNPRQVIGVMPPRYAFPTPGTDVWIPYQLDPANGNFGLHSISAIARLAPGATPTSAKADAESLIARFSEVGYTDASWSTGVFTGEAAVRTLRDDIVGASTRPLLILIGTMAFVLLVAVSNVANLFLVRAETRSHETAVRMALGSGRWRLVQYALAEGILLGLIGGAAGTLLAYAGVRGLVSLAPASIPRLEEIGFNPSVLVFTAGVAILAGLLVSVLPALRWGAPRIASTFGNRGNAGASGRERHRTRNLLVITQVALALALFVGSALMVRSFSALTSVDPGFQSDGVLTFRLFPPVARYGSPDAIVRFYDELLDDLRALPQVSAAGAIDTLPLTGDGRILTTDIEEFPSIDGAFPPTFMIRWVAPGYFEAMGIPMVEGRTLTVRDRSLDPGPVVISQSIKEAYWPRSSALGKRMSVNGYPATVGGVAGDVHNTGLDVPVDRFVYRLGVDPIGPRVRSMTLALRTEADPLGLVGEVRRIVAAIDPDLPVTDIRSMESVVGDSLNRAAFTMAVLALAAVTALILGAVGIYGVLAYAVTRRTGEIGLRQALGADRGSVRRLIIREGLVMGAVGIVAGLAVAVGMGGVLSSSLYGVGPRDVPVLIGASLVLLAVAVLASAIPAFRAARISPAEALRRA